jgi:L-ascorbate metabolism protein UlaG (beta-lactamase superfamily)
MFIEYLAHAAFLLRSKRGDTIIFDPYDPAIGYRPFNRTCDVLVTSHDHYDHCYLPAVHGRAQVFSGAAPVETAKGVKIRGVVADHDECGGGERGKVILTVALIDGLHCCHLGDLGCLLRPDQVEEIGPVDILFIPVGGHHTLDAIKAHKVVDQLNPRLIIPMHYGTGQLRRDEFPLERLDAFVRGGKAVRRIKDSTIEVTSESLPEKQEILVMDYTC